MAQSRSRALNRPRHRAARRSIRMWESLDGHCAVRWRGPLACKFQDHEKRSGYRATHLRAGACEASQMTEAFRPSEFQKAQRSILIAVSLVHGCSDDPFASFTARARAIGGAPIRKCFRIDVNAHDDVSVSLKPPLHFLGNLQPFLPGAWHPVTVVGNSQQCWVISLVDPIDSDHWRGSVL